ncbi:hypothetical protein SLS55_001519 [Diplodia seriata]|uniref:Uncharacterized protein n=1 Tax=Diplodia seriata TaxID=420778 RepID=A0ABR3CS70_9PEZI
MMLKARSAARITIKSTDDEFSIENPLDNLTLEELEEQVAAFRLKYGLANVVDEELLQKGARVAQSGRTFEAIEELTPDELQALRDEHTRLGWDQTGSNGANLEWPAAFDLNPNTVTGDVWILGVVNAAPYFAASMLGFSANLAVYQVPRIGWRLQLGSAFIPAIPLLILIWWAPESPRWYIKKNCYPQAYSSLLRLRNVPLQAARDLYYMHVQIELENRMLAAEQAARDGRRPGEEEATVSRTPVARDLYKAKIFALPAVHQIDTLGRRTLLLITFPGMALTLLAAGFCFYIPDTNEARLDLITFFLFLFAVFYSPGEGPVPFTYSSEAFPLSHREVGMSWAVATNLFWAAILNTVFPRLTDALGNTGALGLFAGLNVLAFVMIFLWVPETKQRTLEELDSIFKASTRKHMRYQVTVTLPWLWKRYVLLQKGAERESFYVSRR